MGVSLTPSIATDLENSVFLLLSTPLWEFPVDWTGTAVPPLFVDNAFYSLMGVSHSSCE